MTQSLKTHRDYTLTPSDLEKAANCMALFRHLVLNVRGQRWEPSTYGQRVGNATHELAAKLGRTRIAGKDITPDELIERSFNPTHFATADQADEGRYAVRDHLRTLGQFIDEHDLNFVAVERFMTLGPCDVASNVTVTFRGKIDAICRRESDGTIISLDLKTGKTLLTPDDLAARPSTSLYRGLTRRVVGRHEHILVGQVLLSTGMSVLVDLTEAQALAAWNFARELVLAMDSDPSMEGPRFTPTPGEHCAFCPLNETCPAFQGGTPDEDLVF